jgi:hypothetical protein
MHEFKRYLLLVLKAGFERWDKGEFMVTLLFAIIPIIGTVIWGWKLEFSSSQWLFGVVSALIFDVIVIIPTKIGMKYIRITTPKLSVELENKPKNNNNQIWWHLIVSNPSNIPIQNCYGQVISFVPNVHNYPYAGMNLAWSSFGSTNTKTVSIPGKSVKLLDVVMTDHSNIYIVGLSPQQAIRGTYFPESAGTYKVEVQVGSESESFEPTIIKIEMILDNRGNLDVKEAKG